jgi:colicin import membrane protein
MSLQIVMSAAVENGMRQASVEFAKQVINQLHSEGALTCDIETAFRMFDFESVSIASKRSVAMKKVRAGQKSSGKASSVAIRSKPEMVLPFCGEVEPSWCQGVRFNHGLHTQCTNGPQTDCKYCKTCQKSASNSASGKPQYGDISDRLTGPLLEYRDPKGKLTTCYANVAKKLGLDIARAQEMATAYGWTIPEDQLTVKVKKTGRPASNKPKKKVGKKGRPAKVKTSEEMTMDDQIAKLVAEAADDVLSVTSESSVKKVVRVKKVKKAKKAKKTDEQKAQEAEAKKAEAEAKKQAKKAEAEAKKQAKKAEAEDKKLAKKAEAEAKKLLKAKEAEEKKLLKAKEAEAKKLLKAKEAEEKKQAKAKEAEEKKLLKAKEAEEKKQAKKAEAEAKKLLKAKAVEDEKKADLKPELTMEAVEQLQATIAEEDDEEEEDIVLDASTPKVEIDGTEYYVTKAYGFPAVLFDQEGECIGAYDETTGEIQELSFEE